jgi:predicted dehydrogenase
MNASISAVSIGGDHRQKLAVVGAGAIGRRHVDAIIQSNDAELFCIVDPTDAAMDYAKALDVPWFPDLSSMFQAAAPDGIVLATPNRFHVEQGRSCIAAAIPVLIEKPIGTDVRSAAALVEAAEKADVPLLVGHHRRHNPLIQATKDRLTAGAIGTIVAVHGMFWAYKPDNYFDVPWRRQPGSGPIFTNLIHDIDLMRWLCGEIETVQALESNAVRGNLVEDTAAILLRFDNGALGTITISDTIVSPWSWEMTSGENPAYPAADESCYLIGGTHGSLEIPKLRLWSNPANRSWFEPFHQDAVPFEIGDPLIRQITHFARVIRRQEPPLVSGRGALKTLAVIEAVKRSARTGQAVHLTQQAGG